MTEEERNRLYRLVTMLANGFVWQRGILLREIRSIIDRIGVKEGK